MEYNLEKQFKINDTITLKLEKNRTNIYINGVLFINCKYLLVKIPVDEIEQYDEINSIDDLEDSLGNERDYFRQKRRITPEAEFWGHCSNIQTWVEHNYDTRILHRNIAFPLLRRLTQVGDENARKAFKEE